MGRYFPQERAACGVVRFLMVVEAHGQRSSARQSQLLQSAYEERRTSYRWMIVRARIRTVIPGKWWPYRRSYLVYWRRF